MKIIATTGIRSEYYILRPVIKELARQGHRVKLILSAIWNPSFSIFSRLAPCQSDK